MTLIHYFIGSAIVFFSTGSGPSYTPARKFNDKRNSMYAVIMYAPTVFAASY